MITRKRSNSLNWGHFVRQTQARFKNRHGKHISARDIKKIWDSFVQMKIIRGVIMGKKIKIDRFATIELVGTPILEDKKFLKMLQQGRMLRRDGAIKKAHIDPKRKDVKYKICYKNSIAKKKQVFFKAAPNFSNQVREALNNTNTYYRIEYVNQ